MEQEVGRERLVKGAFDQRGYFALQIYRLEGTGGTAIPGLRAGLVRLRRWRQNG
jgi:hypothetical protein